MIGNMFSIFLLSRKELKNSFNQETIPSRLKQIYRFSDRTYNWYMRRRDPRKVTVRVFEHKTLIFEFCITAKPIKIGKMTKHFCLLRNSCLSQIF